MPPVNPPRAGAKIIAEQRQPPEAAHLARVLAKIYPLSPKRVQTVRIRRCHRPKPLRQDAWETGENRWGRVRGCPCPRAGRSLLVRTIFTPSPPSRRRHRLDVTPIKARSASDGDSFAPSPPSRRRHRLSVTPIKARSASDGTPGCWARPEMIAGWLVSAEAIVRMVNGIRCHAESPDSRRGLLWGAGGHCEARCTLAAHPPSPHGPDWPCGRSIQSARRRPRASGR